MTIALNVRVFLLDPDSDLNADVEVETVEVDIADGTLWVYAKAPVGDKTQRALLTTSPGGDRDE